MKRIIYSAAAAVATLLVAAMVGTAWMWPMIDEVETGATAEYPEVQPHYYSTEPVRIHEEAVAAIEDMERWTIVDETATTGRVDARRPSSMWGLDADVEVRVEPVTDFVAQVHVRSRTDFDRTDFGQNARNIDEFFAELDDRLGAVLFDPDAVDGDEDDEGDGETDDEAEPGQG